MSIADYVRCQRHPVYFVRQYCQIRHPQRGAIAFALWPWQADLLKQIHRERLCVVLKARQIGVSEIAAAYALWRALHPRPARPARLPQPDRRLRSARPHRLHARPPAPWLKADATGSPASDATTIDNLTLSKRNTRIRAAPPPLSSVDGLTIWDDTVPNRGIIGADVAEGLADGDFDAATLIDAATGKQLAALRGKWPPDIFAHKLYQLGDRYGFPLLAVERNNHGHACLLKLKDLNYPKLYHHEDALKVEGREESRAGWVTNRATKPLIVDALATLREDTYQPMDPILISEALVFSYQNNSTMSAPDGFHDDTVIVHAIAIYLAGQPDAILSTMQLFADLEKMKRPNL